MGRKRTNEFGNRNRITVDHDKNDRNITVLMEVVQEVGLAAGESKDGSVLTVALLDLSVVSFLFNLLVQTQDGNNNIYVLGDLKGLREVGEIGAGTGVAARSKQRSRKGVVLGKDLERLLDSEDVVGNSLVDGDIGALVISIVAYWIISLV